MSHSRTWLLFLTLALTVIASGCFLKPKHWPAVPSPPSPPAPTGQFSVVWDKQDLNAFPLNPQWAEQRDHHQLPTLPNDEQQNVCVRRPDLPTCTAQATVRDDKPPNLFWRAACGLILSSKIHGHVDWTPATYFGALNWIHLNWGDSDYNFRLFPEEDNLATQHGLTQNNEDLNGNKYIEVEFDSRETAGRLGTPTWKAFAEAAESPDPDRMKRWLDPQHGETSPFALVTGLFNLDCEHDCRSELHPLYAMAIETNDSPDDDTWAILVRNWGNGGSCSGLNQQLELGGGQFNLVLPNASGKAPAMLWDKLEFAVSNLAIPFPKLAFIQGVGYVLTFTLPDPAERPLIELVFHLRWAKGTIAPRVRLPLPSVPAGMANAAGPRTESEESAESYLASLFQRIGRQPGGSNPAMFEVPPPSLQDHLVTPPRLSAITKFRAPATLPTTSAQPPTLRFKGVSDEVKVKRDNAMFRSLCAAYREKDQTLPTDKIPDLPKLCESREMQ